MRSSLKHMLIIGLVFTLFGCITSYSPIAKEVTLKAGQTKIFTATTNQDGAELVWFLDGSKVAEGSKYEYTATCLAFDDKASQQLLVREVVPNPLRPGSSVTWMITVDCSIPTPTPEATPTPTPEATPTPTPEATPTPTPEATPTPTPEATPTPTPEPTPTPAAGKPNPPVTVHASDESEGLTDIEVTWDASNGATYYKVYRAIFEEDGNYELVGDNITGTAFTFEQTWDEVEAQTGPTPGLAGDATDSDKLQFLLALNDYREKSLPIVFDFKAPAYFKVEACNDEGCSAMSAADLGQANYIHTQQYSEVAMQMISLWGHAQLVALADAPGKIKGLSWCGIDLCGSGGGVVMGRVALDGAMVNVDVVYDNYTEALAGVDGAYALMNGSLGGQMGMGMAYLGHFWIKGEFEIKTSNADVTIDTYTEICGTDRNGNPMHDGYANITYKGETYQFSLPVQAVDDISGHAARPIEPIIPARTDVGQWTPSTGDYPVPFVDQAPANNCLHNWTDYTIETCTESVVAP